MTGPTDHLNLVPGLTKPRVKGVYTLYLPFRKKKVSPQFFVPVTHGDGRVRESTDGDLYPDRVVRRVLPSVPGWGPMDKIRPPSRNPLLLSRTTKLKIRKSDVRRHFPSHTPRTCPTHYWSQSGVGRQWGPVPVVRDPWWDEEVVVTPDLRQSLPVSLPPRRRMNIK